MPQLFDLVIVGGGMLGLRVATLAANDLRKRALVIRRDDALRPRADSLRNQSWLQSGLAYRLEDFRDLAHLIEVGHATYYQGRRLLDDVQVSPSRRRAINRLPLRAELKEKVLRDLDERREAMDIPREEVQPVPDDLAKELLGRLYEAGSEYISLPDGPFDEAEVLARLRAAATDETATTTPASFLVVDDPIELRRSSTSPSGVAIHIGKTIIEPPTLLFAAGSGIIPLVDQLGLTVPFSLQQTPLFVVDDDMGLRAPLLIDKTTGFSAILHPNGSPDGGSALVVGTGERSTGVAFTRPEHRFLLEAQIDDFFKVVSEPIRAARPHGRFTAGVEMIPSDTIPNSMMEPWCEELMPGVVAAVPGRATMTAAAGDLVMRSLVHRFHYAKQNDIGPVSVDTEGWDSSIHMHYERHYSFDDREDIGSRA